MKHKRTAKYKYLRIIYFIAAIIIIIAGYLWSNNIGEDEIYLLPNHFIGIVTVIFSQRDGVPVKYENGKRVYEIPSNGVLKTQFRQNFGLHKMPSYYYVDGKNNRHNIPYVIKSEHLTTNAISVYGQSSGKNGNEATRYVDFDMFIVSTKKDADSLHKASEKIYPLELISK